MMPRWVLSLKTMVLMLSMFFCMKMKIMVNRRGADQSASVLSNTNVLQVSHFNKKRVLVRYHWSRGTYGTKMIKINICGALIGRLDTFGYRSAKCYEWSTRKRFSLILRPLPHLDPINFVSILFLVSVVSSNSDDHHC